MIIKVNKQLILEAVNGAWDKTTHADHQLMVNRDAALSQTYRNNKGQYFLNPFVDGSMNHLNTKIRKGYNGIMYDVLANNDSRALTVEPTVKVKEGNTQAWNGQMDAELANQRNHLQNIEKIKTENPAQYYLNPFTAGPLGNTVANRKVAGLNNMRSVYSPTTQVGSTLEKGTV